ncbi:ribonuclease HI [candidate division KSB3 bacterium]|uniref:Ribonuclease H n=1 Tax=candidate division KSB3 bacterium TaxID=2044937 RepID=A0A9D5JW50_9BACT|nr:ribonuclease HI [candidate division KSB3 bacterium]MBD3325240.1 ribonuclease HI [candidate division KSB3 bacterium]
MGTVKIYTDGACSNNPYGNGGYGTIIVAGDQRLELSGGFQNTTNNRMEMRAVIVGLEALQDPCDVTLYSDSKYIVDSINKGWVSRWKANNWMRNKKDPALNVDLWQRILELCQKHRVTFQWVRGHAGHPENERCDELAVAALQQEDLPDDLPSTSSHGTG